MSQLSFKFEIGEHIESQSQSLLFLDDEDEEHSLATASRFTRLCDSMMFVDETPTTVPRGPGGFNTREHDEAHVPILGQSLEEQMLSYDDREMHAQVQTAELNFVDDYSSEVEASAPAALPPWRCEFCNIHTPAAVAKCVASGKWFCNHKQPGLPASCIVYHLVKSRNNEVMLHKESPLGEIILECFLTGWRNVFQPVSYTHLTLPTKA